MSSLFVGNSFKHDICVGGGVDDALLRSVDVEQDGTRQKQFDTLLRSTLQRFDEN